MMADFAQTMKDWHRMCKAMTDKDSHDACSGCPLEVYGCSPIYEGLDTYKDVDFEVVGERIAEWAQKNPEPVYPTWYEYLTDLYDSAWGDIYDKCIPADIAEKLGLKPKGDK